MAHPCSYKSTGMHCMPIMVKVIKPQRLKVGAFRLEMLNAMRKAGKTIEKEDYGAIYRTWKHKPKMEVLISLTGPGPVLLIGTDDEIYRYLDKGTKGPYRIPKSGETLLRFKEGYKAKTVPGVLQSRPGGPFGDAVFVKGHVMHPGIKARNFEKQIAKKRTKWFKRQMQDAMIKANKKAGHAI